MQKKVHTVRETDTVTDVLSLMIHKKTNGVVVVDDENVVVGILSSWDVIKHIVPDYLEDDRHLAAFEAGDVFEKRVHEVAHDPVSKFMTQDVHTAKESDTLISAITMLAEFHIRQLPIVDDSGHLVGYVNRTDMKQAAGDILRISAK